MVTPPASPVDDDATTEAELDLDQPLSNAAIDADLRTMDGWRREDRGIRKRIRCASFADGVFLVNLIAALAEQQEHHPDIDIRGRNIIVFLTSYEAGGVTPRDFLLARAIDAAVSSAVPG